MKLPLFGNLTKDKTFLRWSRHVWIGTSWLYPSSFLRYSTLSRPCRRSPSAILLCSGNLLRIWGQGGWGLGNYHPTIVCETKVQHLPFSSADSRIGSGILITSTLCQRMGIVIYQFDDSRSLFDDLCGDMSCSLHESLYSLPESSGYETYARCLIPLPHIQRPLCDFYCIVFRPPDYHHLWRCLFFMATARTIVHLVRSLPSPAGRTSTPALGAHTCRTGVSYNNRSCAWGEITWNR